MAGVKEISDRVSEKLGLTKKVSHEVVEEVFRAVNDFVIYSPVTIREFGTFKRVVQRERNSRNPKTNEPIVVPAKTRLKFKETGRK